MRPDLGPQRAILLVVALAMAVIGCSRPPGARPEASQAASPTSSSSAAPGASPSADVPSATATSSAAARPAGTTVATATVEDVAPQGLIGKPWAVLSPDALIVGSIGNRSRLRLPASRDFLAMSDTVVVTGQRKADGSSTKVFFSNRGQGSDVIPPVTVPGQVFVAVLAGDEVYATGFDKDSSGDPGVVAISVVDGSTRIVLPAGPAPAGVSAPIGRNLLVSPSGRTVLSAINANGYCRGGTVIDATSRTVVGALDSKDCPSAVSDEIALVRTGDDLTTELAAVSLATGAELWRAQADEIYHAFVTDAGATVALLSRNGKPVLERTNRTGNARQFDRLQGELPSLWIDQSSAALAVVGHEGPFPGKPNADGVLSADVFDLSAWSLTPSALRLDLDGN